MDNVFSIANMGIVKALIKLAETRVMTQGTDYENQERKAEESRHCGCAQC